MAKIIGRLVQLGLAKEATRGAGAAPSLWIPQTSFSVRDAIEEARVEGALGSIADSEEKLVLEKYAEGELGGELRSQSIGLLLYSLLGTYSVASDGSGYVHSFSLEEGNQHQSLAMSIVSSIEERMFRRAMVDSLEINVESGGLVNFTAGFMAAQAASTDQTYSRPTDYKFSKKHVTLKVAANIAGLSGASGLEVKSFNIAFNSNIERDSVLGTVHPIDLLNKQFSIEGSITLLYEDNTWRDYMLNGDEKALKFKIENTDEDLGSSEYPYLDIQLPKVDFSGWEPNYALEDIVSQTINFKANYDSTNGLIETCDLFNGYADYDA